MSWKKHPILYLDYGTMMFIILVSRSKKLCPVGIDENFIESGINDQSVHMNETFKGNHCMILHQNQQYINRKCASTCTETAALSNMI